MVRPPRRPVRCFLPPVGGAVPRVRFPVAAAQRRLPPPHQASRRRNLATTEEKRGETGQRQLGGPGSTGGSGETVPKRARMDGVEDHTAVTNQEVLSGSHGSDEEVPVVDQQEAAEDGRSAELQSAGSLKVTIQRRHESREFRLTPAGPHCHVCKLTCRTPQLFQNHMCGPEHQEKLQEVTRCIRLHTRLLQERGHRPETQRWCDTCQTHYSGDVIVHRQTKRHKVYKRRCRPYCAACRCHFRTPRKFVEHMKCEEHKEKVQQEEAQEGELITVDAIGCFQEEQEEEEEVEQEEGEEVVDEEEEEPKEVVIEVEEEETDSDSHGFVVPVSGFLCRLCNKFFYTAAARHTHCRTHTHRLNLQSHRALRREEDGGLVRTEETG